MNTLTEPLNAIHAQSDLFGESETRFSIDTTFQTAKRFALDAHSWVDIVPGWISGASLLYEQMRNSVPWLEHDRRMFNKVFREPRMTAAYQDLGAVPQQGLLQAVRALSSHYGVVYDGLWMNLYRNGQDSTGWHRDHRSCRKLECIVPVLTLGTTRRFLIKPIKGGSSMTFKPSSGDLVVMGGRSQQDWVHCVPKEPGIVEARISVNFMSSAQGVSDRL
ncbi:alpha-ketoglutarate-dependent dioxygenase AlkB [Paraburkholderia bannensis]|uniref:alpha-ketoglutarate-dependent dioxygenase AlkB n=1 Tax=Paraburkholderia bannensis TaxID=765414 RepID=UPI000693D124|nr:alpha-ketoglutarate-dependent dioxygenase AlkB [Paraburkholderia bannensis]